LKAFCNSLESGNPEQEDWIPDQVRNDEQRKAIYETVHWSLEFATIVKRMKLLYCLISKILLQLNKKNVSEVYYGSKRSA